MSSDETELGSFRRHITASAIVSNRSSVAAASITIGDDTFLRAHREFLWNKVRSQFQVELLGKVFQFGAAIM